QRDRYEIERLLRRRQGLTEVEEVEREIDLKVPSLDVQKQNYLRWARQRGAYYTPTPEQVDLMWSALEEGDQVIFDFALTITVKKPDGLLIAIDRRGKQVDVSPYSPAVRDGNNNGNGKKPK
ncbi:MAG TPA: hypothetical protein VFA65_01535, partial [Bryobacteraceae bacterium]|nr:hypothetical protein [Bryobacteraceae bacterium]